MSQALFLYYFLHFLTCIHYNLLISMGLSLRSAINSFTTVAVTYMNEVLKMNGTEIGIVFLTVMLSTIPGSVFATWLSNLKNPQFCYRLNIFTFMITIFGFLLLDGPGKKMLMYGMAVIWGFWIGKLHLP